MESERHQDRWKVFLQAPQEIAKQLYFVTRYKKGRHQHHDNLSEIRDFGVWRPPVGVVFWVESIFKVEHFQILHPEANIEEKLYFCYIFRMCLEGFWEVLGICVESFGKFLRHFLEVMGKLLRHI